MEQNNRTNRILRYSLIAILLIIIVVAIVVVYNLESFHLVSTSPVAADISPVTPTIKLDFNQRLANTKITISDQPKIVKSYKIQNGQLILNLITPMNPNHQYKLVLKDMQTINNNKIKQFTYSFKPSDQNYGSLPMAQQKAIIKQQTQKPAPTFVHFSALINNGLSTTQILQMQKDLVSFSATARSFIVIANTVSPGPRNPNTASSFSLNFTIDIDNQSYLATATYTNTTNIQLSLTNPNTKTVVYNS